MKNQSIALTAILLALGFLSPAAHAQCQDGCDLFLHNTFQGEAALVNNTTGVNNVAVGAEALVFNTEGINNTAIGSQALRGNGVGLNNTAIGSFALVRNQFGSNNTAVGADALFDNFGGSNNTGTGFGALRGETRELFVGDFNTASGALALHNNGIGEFNTASGANALLLNTEGSGNVAEGFQALSNNTTGRENTGIGLNALFSNTTGSRNTALGTGAGGALTTGSDNIVIGNSGIAGDSNTIRIGTQGTQTRTFVAGIIGTALGPGVAVRVNLFGQLGTVGSSARFKQNIKAMDKASEAIHALKPVTFRYKDEIDPEGGPQFGLIAEDVAKVNPDLVARDAKGELYTVRYEAVNAMLLNEFLKEHRKVEKLEATVAQQRKDFEAAVAQLKAQVQKVSAQLELSRPAPRSVKNDY
jgi:Chaperone of endosialidase